MKIFAKKVILFTIITLMVINIRPFYLFFSNKYKNTVAGNEIYYSILKSKQKKKTKKILLGDSVGQQLFPNTSTNDTVNSLACNQAISMLGQYILLNNYLEAGNNIDTVFMLFTPFSFMNNLDQIYTYHYFLKPFYTSEYKKFFSDRVNSQIDKIPFKFFCRLPIILTSNWAPDFVRQDTINYTFLSPISIEYLNRMKQLSVQYNFKLILFPPPIKISAESIIDKINKDEIQETKLVSEFEYYFKEIKYLDDSCFLDGTHLKFPEQYRSYWHL